MERSTVGTHKWIYSNSEYGDLVPRIMLANNIPYTVEDREKSNTNGIIDLSRSATVLYDESNKKKHFLICQMRKPRGFDNFNEFDWDSYLKK